MIDQDYKDIAKKVSFNVANKVLPMNELPDSLKQAYDGMFEELIADKAGAFAQGWDKLPASAQRLITQAEFHGFYIANAWMQLSRVAQEIADSNDTEEEMSDKEYDGVFGRLAEQSLKECFRKLKKARTDRVMLNSLNKVMAD
ncbi:DUF3069 domain-containing protein [Shewanella gaetbuli]|uniref:DUF3069 domain-containing protein n=1 Tax=Shewanella gaetbuli TaxID=220752 RepID=A0A9X1ZFC1_9GAMM|nr:DUF3069 domain-containing protein [Shewanella gaetbuli]MCL1141329.1 DUF3069 domain-containing protein [Shewanella gaetbuli]